MKITQMGWAVLENDTHISRWVEQRGDLENERYVIENFIASRIPLRGYTIIDVGAMIGDHTATYSRLAGPDGLVLAFEPNPEAYECLSYNVARFQHRNVHIHNFALGETFGKAAFIGNPNVGASHLEPVKPESSGKAVEVLSLDSVWITAFNMPPVKLLKIDAEGYEPFVLRGSQNVLRTHKPAVYYEVHQNALARNNSSPAYLKDFLRKFGYSRFDILEKCSEDSPQYNVLAT